MPLRILCLHGQGVNSDIFKKQTEDVRAMLSPDYHFFFFDGKYEFEPAPGVLEVFPPPYLTWYTTPTTQKVSDAHRQVLQIIEHHGPFDAVMGFSQGAAVAASLMLHQELDQNKPPLFKAAIFIASPVPFSHRTDVGIDARKYFGVSETPPNEHGRPTTIPAHLLTDPAYLRNPSQLGETGSSEGVRYQMFHPTTDSVRIRVATGHIYGSLDEWFHHSKDLAGLCLEDTRTVFQHDAGHSVPRAYTEEMCDLIETVFAKIG